jgi:hypothetical protein
MLSNNHDISVLVEHRITRIWIWDLPELLVYKGFLHWL